MSLELDLRGKRALVIGVSSEIGALCAFLASEWGGFISGTTILADGGRSALMQDGGGYG